MLSLQLQPDSIPSSPSPLLTLHSDLSSPPDPDPTTPDDISQVLDEFDNLSTEFDNILEKKDDIKLSENLQNLFPEADQIKKNWRQNKKWSTLPNIEKIIQELTKGKTLVQLDFFSGGKNEKFQIKAMQLGLSEKNIVF